MTAAREPTETEERFQRLESKILYQDRTIDELNAIVTHQQDQIDRLILETKKLRDTIESGSGGGIDATEEPPPPHY